MRKIGLIFLGFLLFACSILPATAEDGGGETDISEQENATSSFMDDESLTTVSDATASVEALMPTAVITGQAPADEMPALPEMAENFYDYLLPIPLGERATVDHDGMKITVRVEEAILDQEDVYIYTQLFPMVWEAPQRMKYLVFLIGIEYLEGASSERVDMLSNLDFTTIRQGHILDSAEVSYHIDGNVSDLLLAPGESGQAFLAGLSYEGDTSPILKLDVGEQHYLFSLIPRNVQSEPIPAGDATIIAADDGSIGTPDTPVPLGTTRTLYEARQGVFLNIRVEEVRRGSDAWRLLHDYWELNEPAPQGYEYILPMVSIQRIDAPGDVRAIENDFYIFSREENTPDAELWSCPMPCLSDAALLYPGGTAIGWIPLLVPQDEPVPLLTYGNQVYFSLVDENALSGGTVVFDEDAIGYDTIDRIVYYQTLRLPTVVYSLAFSPDHSILAAGCDNRKFYIFDTQDGSEMAVLDGHTGSVRAISFSLQD